MDVQVLRYEAAGWGTGELWLDDGRLVYHELPRPGADRVPPSGSSLSPENAGVAHGSTRRRAGGVPEWTGTLIDALGGYFAGRDAAFPDVPLELDWCTPFQRSLADALRAIGRGHTVTYGELAALAGRPNAPRAAGSFCAGNRFPILLPCHRVVAAGGLGAYGELGPGYKRRLLALEGVLA